MNRRSFFKWATATGAALFLPSSVRPSKEWRYKDSEAKYELVTPSDERHLLKSTHIPGDLLHETGLYFMRSLPDPKDPSMFFMPMFVS